MIEDSSARKALNYLYLSINEAMLKLPFSGRYWLEEVSKGMALRILKEYGSKDMFKEKDPLEVCRTYIKLLESIEFIDSANDYLIEKADSDSLKVTLKRETCIYREFSKEVLEKELIFKCPRITSLLAALEWVLGKKYSSTVEISNGICHGRIFPKHKKDEIVTQEEHILKIADRRAILLSKATYSSFLEAIKNYAPHILRHVLYDAGFKSFIPLAEKAKNMYPEPLEYLNMLLDELKSLGLCKATLKSLDISTRKAVIWCYDSFQIPSEEFEVLLYRSPRGMCDLLRGTFAAYLSVYFNEEIICEEMHCQSVNSEHCEFVTFPLNYQQY